MSNTISNLVFVLTLVAYEVVALLQMKRHIADLERELGIGGRR